MKNKQNEILSNFDQILLTMDHYFQHTPNLQEQGFSVTCFD